MLMFMLLFIFLIVLRSDYVYICRKKVGALKDMPDKGPQDTISMQAAVTTN